MYKMITFCELELKYVIFFLVCDIILYRVLSEFSNVGFVENYAGLCLFFKGRTWLWIIGSTPFVKYTVRSFKKQTLVSVMALKSMCEDQVTRLPIFPLSWDSLSFQVSFWHEKVPFLIIVPHLTFYLQIQSNFSLSWVKFKADLYSFCGFN